jgi:YidC/Oxa1 family membrane protein insertase
MWNSLLNALGAILAFFYGIVPSYGLAIILLTVTVRLVLFPITAKQARSMIAMQRIQPEIKKLQAKYKDDRQKLNEEIMRFYKENKVNPAAGCLPLVAQMPVFFALFRVLRETQKHIPVGSDLFRALCGEAQNAHGCKHPKGLGFLGMNLRVNPGDHHSSFANALPYFVLVGLVILTGYIQQRQMQGKQPASAQNAQAKLMGQIFPIFFGFISLKLPAGVVLYFFVSNLWQMGQQSLVYRNLDLGSPAPPGSPPSPADDKPPPPPPPPTERAGGGGPSRAADPNRGARRRSRNKKRRR